MRYAVAVYEEGGSYHIEIPDFKMRWEYPRTTKMEFLVSEGKRRLLETIQTYLDTRDDLPRPKATPKLLNSTTDIPSYKAKWFTIPTHQSLKIEAYWCWRSSNLTETKLARLSGMSRMGVRSLFKLDVMSELRNIVNVFDACGYTIDFTITRKELT